jgi:hypothetical protein
MTNEEKWLIRINKLLKGKKILSVRYMTATEATELGWNQRAIAIHLDDGTIIFPSSDDEGNEAGSLFTTDEQTPIIHVI